MSNHDSPETRSRRFEEAADWFFRLQDENQSTEQIERWIEWCRADPQNQQAFEHLMPLWQVRRAMPENTPMAAAAVASLTPARRRRRIGVRGWLAAAASVAALGLGALFWIRNQSLVRLDQVASFDSELGQVRSARLIDGSQIALGAQSSIAVNFSGGRREIEIERGETFFKVQHDRNRPFVVRAGGLQVIAVGTAFDVDRRGARVSVTVQDGVVEVSDQGAAGPAPVLRVARGSQLVFDPSRSQTASVRAVNPDSADAWRRGRFEYVDEPLDAVIEDLNRYSSQHIVLQDSVVGAMRYSGTIDVTLIDEWLRALPNIFQMRVQFGSDHQVSLSRPQMLPQPDR